MSRRKRYIKGKVYVTNDKVLVGGKGKKRKVVSMGNDSRGIPTQVCKVLPAREIVGKMQDFCTKFVLFDDSIEWERDVMHYTRRKQLTIIDILCNPPRVA